MSRSAERRVLWVGHRGAAAHEPQNTLRSFERAIAMGVAMIETDVRQSRDGALVLAHDATVHGGGRELTVAEHSLTELRSLDLGPGERVVTLEEVLSLVRGRCGLMADLKGEGFEAELVASLQASGLPREQIVIPGGTAHSRTLIRQLDPSLPISLSLGAEWHGRISNEFIDAIDTDAVTWQYRLITPERVARLHERGLFVYAWTVDDPETLRGVLDAGVDGVITNRPELFEAVSQREEVVRTSM
jgi:glycerophosphoryl diester phosphodiesterase